MLEGDHSGRLAELALHQVQGRRKSEKGRANACLRKKKTKIWSLGLPFRNPLVTLQSSVIQACGQSLAWKRWKAGVSQEFREPQDQSSFKQCQNCWVSTHSCFCIFFTPLSLPRNSYLNPIFSVHLYGVVPFHHSGRHFQKLITS